jgi:hypothetical protein
MEKRMRKVIEVSIYKWTLCAIFSPLLSSPDISPCACECVCAGIMIARARARAEKGGKFLHLFSLLDASAIKGTLLMQFMDTLVGWFSAGHKERESGSAEQFVKRQHIMILVNNIIFT